MTSDIPESAASKIDESVYEGAARAHADEGTARTDWKRLAQHPPFRAAVESAYLAGLVAAREAITSLCGDVTDTWYALGVIDAMVDEVGRSAQCGEAADPVRVKIGDGVLICEPCASGEHEDCDWDEQQPPCRCECPCESAQRSGVAAQNITEEHS